MAKTKYQIITFDIASAGEQKTINTNTKLDHDRVTGVFLSIKKSSEIAAAVEVGSTIQLVIDSEEIFPEGFEVANLTKKVAVDINNLPHLLDERAKNSTVKIVYKDGNSALFPSGGYTINVYLRAVELDVEEKRKLKK